MKIYIHEYNICSKEEDKQTLLIEIEENKFVINGNKFENRELTEKIKKLFISYKDTILKLKEVVHRNYKGGRQKQLRLYLKEICDEEIIFIGNTEFYEISDFYEEIKGEVIHLLQDYFKDNGKI